MIIPSREIDLRILEELCGWKRPKPPFVDGYIPPLSSDATACFAYIIPAMRKHPSRACQLTIQDYPSSSHGCTAQWRTDEGDIVSRGIGSTIPEAVCCATIEYLDAQKAVP